MKEKVTVCIVHHNTPEWLGAALRRLKKHTNPCPRIIVVDNGSNTEAAKQAASLTKASGARMLALPTPVPHGAAVDAVLPKISSEWLLVMDSDAFPVKDGWLANIASIMEDNTALAGASAGIAHSENPFGNYVHPSLCLVNMAFLLRSGSSFRDAWPRWDTGEQLTMDAIRLGWQVRYLQTTHFDLFGHGVLLDGCVFHAYYGTRLKIAAGELQQQDGVDVQWLRAEHSRLLDAEQRFFLEGGPNPFAKEDADAAAPRPEVSVIIPFRRRDDVGERNLRAVVESLNSQTLERNRYVIILVEAAPAPSVSEMPGCHMIFAFCPDALFHKSWAMNVGFRRARGDVLVFNDADVVVPDTMLESVAKRISRGCPAVKPSYTVLDINREWTDKMRSKGVSVARRIAEGVLRLRSAPGGSIAVMRKQFLKIRGFNEMFAGWGGEDDEFLMRLRAHGWNPPDLGCKLYHLWHDQIPKDQERLIANRRLAGHIRSLNRRAIRNYAAAMPGSFGDNHAFRRRKVRQPKHKRKISVLLAGAYSKTGPDANVGDDATRDVLLSLVKRRGCVARISPKHPCTDAHIVGTDAIVIGGGGLISDHNEDAFYNYMSYLKHGAAKGVPVVILGVGVCQLAQKRSRVSSLMRGADAVCVRDTLSRDNLESGDFADVSTDLGWLLEPRGRPIVPISRRSAGVFIVGNSYADSKAYKASVHKVVDGLVAEGLCPVLVIHARDDKRAVASFLERYPDATVLDYFESNSNTPASLVVSLSRMERIVTSRYHGIIFSALAGTPCQVMPNSPEKVAFLRDEIGASRLATQASLPRVVEEMRLRAKKNVKALLRVIAKARKSVRPELAETKVSVCMITLNDGAYIRKTLASIPRISQIGEILAVDGGSTDETLEVLENDGRVKVLRRPFPHDFSDQKNFCISQASRDWIVWVDSDEAFPDGFWDTIEDMILSGRETFRFPRENFIGNGPTPTNDITADPDYQFRFFSRKCRWVGKVHEHLVGYEGSPGKAEFVICHRKSRPRQDWNDRYYAWINGVGNSRPSHSIRAGT